MSVSPTRHPAVLEHELKRADDVQVRLADTITRFAGSMGFVYLHMVAFAHLDAVRGTQSVADAHLGRVA